MIANEFERYKREISRLTYDNNLDRALKLMLELIERQQKELTKLTNELHSNKV